VSHGNARTTVQGRKLIVARYKAGWRQAHIAAAMGISRKCVRTWITRYKAEGEAGLADRSSRPHTSPTRTPTEVEDRIVAVRTSEGKGPAWIGAELGVPARTVSRVLVRRGQPPLSALDPMTGEVIRSSKQTATRYERSRPGELVHMDVKKLGRIPDGGGWRAHGRAAGSTSRDRATRVGYDYVHSLVDDHSRLAYSEVLADEKGATCAGFLTRAAVESTGQRNTFRILEVCGGEVGSAGHERRVSRAVMGDVGRREVVQRDLEGDRLSARLGLHGDQTDRGLCSAAA
jgi:transposase